MWLWITILVCILLAAAVWYLMKSGLFDRIEIKIARLPEMSMARIYYKFHIGPYRNVGSLIKEATDLLPKGSTAIGIYYDDPRKIAGDRLRSAIGVVVAEDGGEPFYGHRYETQLSRWGYTAFTLPPHFPHSVVARHRSSTRLSMLLAVYRLYPKITAFMKKQRLKAGPAIELYKWEKDGPRCNVHIAFPLNSHSSFYVPEAAAAEAKNNDI